MIARLLAERVIALHGMKLDRHFPRPVSPSLEIRTRRIAKMRHQKSKKNRQENIP